MDGDTLRPANASGHLFQVVINGRPVSLEDRRPQGAQLLAAGGFEPVDDHGLIEKMPVGSRLISLDEVVELKHEEPNVFFAFRGGDVFLFTVNTHGYQWGRPTIAEEEIRDIANVPDDKILLLERGDEEPRLLGPGDTVQLGHAGTEHLRTESRLIKVFIDGDPKEIERGVYTTEQLILVLGVEAGYLLNLQRKDGLEPLKAGQKLRVEPGMRFFSQAPGGGSS